MTLQYFWNVIKGLWCHGGPSSFLYNGPNEHNQHSTISAPLFSPPFFFYKMGEFGKRKNYICLCTDMWSWWKIKVLLHSIFLYLFELLIFFFLFLNNLVQKPQVMFNTFSRLFSFYFESWDFGKRIWKVCNFYLYFEMELGWDNFVGVLVKLCLKIKRKYFFWKKFGLK